MRRKKTAAEDEAFQMAPMIDMVFLLLVFFMTVSTISSDNRPEVSLPESRTIHQPEEVTPRLIVSLTVDTQSEEIRYFLGASSLGLNRLQEALEKNKAELQANGCTLRVNKDARFLHWRPILDLLRTLGTSELGITVFEGSS